MGYPYGETYLSRIQKDRKACMITKELFYAYRLEWMNEHKCDIPEVPLEVQFQLLGKAFNYGSTIYDITDQYHFMDDVVEELLAN